MKDEIQTLRQRLQDLHESHATGFVDDAQYAQARTLLERKLVDAVMRSAPTPPPAIAQAAPGLAAAEPTPSPARIKWLPWLAAAAVAHVLVGLAYWWATSGGSHAEVVAGGTLPTAVAARAAEVDALLPAATPAIDTVPAKVPAALSVATSISGTVALTPALALKAHASDTVFVFARALDGPPMPLAVIRKQVRDLPLQFTLDDSMAMWPAARVSGYPRVVVTARVSKSGEGQPRPGDLQGESPVVAAGVSGLHIEIGKVVEQ